MNSESLFDKSVLLEIDLNLRKSELKTLKFLSKDIVPAGDLEKISYSYELFENLMNRTNCNLSDGRLVTAQFLQFIGRNDLVLKLGIDYNSLKDVVDKCTFLSPFRIMIFELLKNMIVEDIKCLKFLLLKENIPKHRFLEITDGEDLFNSLELIYPNKNELQEKLESCFSTMKSHDLMDILKRFKFRQDLRTGASSASLLSNLTLENENNSLDETLLDYPMSHSPLGICLIINNKTFDSTEDGPRHGTDLDADIIGKVFKSLDFKVEYHKDLKAVAMKNVIQSCGKYDHSNYDCFFAFILSHGRSGHVLGTDGNTLGLRSVLSPFKNTNCSSLKDKPKVFCIQACQGTDVVNDDLATDDVDNARIIEEADFLLSLSSLPGYLSVRSVISGTWYIQTLAEIIKAHHKKLDFLKMLTIVTRKVNEKKGKTRLLRQVPIPMSTLTKELYLCKKRLD